MMDITHLGHSSFRLKGKAAVIVTDPFPKQEAADILAVSHDHFDHNKIYPGPFVVNGPGEYEIKGVTVVGVATYHDSKNGQERGKNVAYRIEIDGISVCHLGDLGHKLTTEQLEQLDGIDVLLIPVGGVYTIDAKLAAEVVAQINPKIVVPMHYREKNFEDLAGVEGFLKEMGIESLAPVAKLSISKDRLPEQLQVVVLG